MKYSTLVLAWLTCGLIMYIRWIVMREWPEPEGALLAMAVTLLIAVKSNTFTSKDKEDNRNK